MKKKSVLIVALVILCILALVAYFVASPILFLMYGKEDTSGPQGAIPRPADTFAPITKGKADWPCWRGPSFDGRSTVTGIRKDWSGGLRKLWEVGYLCQGKHASTWSAPVVQGNRLVVPGRDEKRDLVFCLNPEDGESLWLGSYEAKAGTTHGPGARATPFIDDDRVYTFGRSGDLACWRLRDGKLVWRKNVADAGGNEPRWGHSSSPLVYKDKVIVQGGGTALTVAYDKMTGDLAWKSMEGDAGYAASVLVPADQGARLLIFHGVGLSFLDAADGRELWSVPWKTRYGVNATTPAVAGTTVFISSGYDEGCQALEMGDREAKVLWQNKTIASHHSDPVILDGFLYGYSGSSSQNKGHFKCLDLKTGDERWSTSEIGWGTALHVDGHLLCMDIKGNLFLVNPDPDRFIKVTEFRGALGDPKHPAWTIPVVANGKLYLRYRQRLVCYSLLP